MVSRTYDKGCQADGRKLEEVDFVIEIRDARIPDSSRNPMLDGIIHTKPRLIILSKKDKADPKLTKEWITY